MTFQMEAAAPETTRIDRRRARTTRALLDSAARLFAEQRAAAIEKGCGEETRRPVPPLPAARFLWASLTGAVALNLRPGMLQIGVEQAVEVAQLGQLIIAEGLAGPGLRGPDGLLAPE